MDLEDNYYDRLSALGLRWEAYNDSNEGHVQQRLYKSQGSTISNTDIKKMLFLRDSVTDEQLKAFKKVICDYWRQYSRTAVESKRNPRFKYEISKDLVRLTKYICKQNRLDVLETDYRLGEVCKNIRAVIANICSTQKSARHRQKEKNDSRPQQKPDASPKQKPNAAPRKRRASSERLNDPQRVKRIRSQRLTPSRNGRQCASSPATINDSLQSSDTDSSDVVSSQARRPSSRRNKTTHNNIDSIIEVDITQNQVLDEHSLMNEYTGNLTPLHQGTGVPNSLAEGHMSFERSDHQNGPIIQCTVGVLLYDSEKRKLEEVYLTSISQLLGQNGVSLDDGSSDEHIISSLREGVQKAIQALQNTVLQAKLEKQRWESSCFQIIQPLRQRLKSIRMDLRQQIMEAEAVLPELRKEKRERNEAWAYGLCIPIEMRWNQIEFERSHRQEVVPVREH